MQVRIPKFVESQVGSEIKSTHRIKIIYGDDFILENVIYSNDIPEKNKIIIHKLSDSSIYTFQFSLLRIISQDFFMGQTVETHFLHFCVRKESC